MKRRGIVAQASGSVINQTVFFCYFSGMAPALHVTTEYKSGVGPYKKIGLGVPKFCHKDFELHQ